MYYILLSKRYAKSLKKLQRGGKVDVRKLEEIVNTLAQGKKLDSRHKDHQLQGELKKYRECHVENDLLLMYIIEKDALTLTLSNIGTHAEFSNHAL